MKKIMEDITSKVISEIKNRNIPYANIFLKNKNKYTSLKDYIITNNKEFDYNLNFKIKVELEDNSLNKTSLFFDGECARNILESINERRNEEKKDYNLLQYLLNKKGKDFSRDMFLQMDNNNTVTLDVFLEKYKNNKVINSARNFDAIYFRDITNNYRKITDTSLKAKTLFELIYISSRPK